ncbi:YfcC family protein [Brevibacillus sp. 1238]|uniref:YfcC family protein n=1 Tax=unclassified Brevibacillus TaxID=2684853 RepID=UPI00156A9428|nr:putative basic amino acid antiporter YfcC [Brevibacillus sp. 1238]MDH6348394.1 putative ion transporter superfamily protein YfcC [Brevibacillus sp. 1238]NRQ52904.1 putative basic amino acid antiporter YfcC [Brevibacillus sp. HD1.4A]
MLPNSKEQAARRKRGINVFVLLFGVLLIATFLTHVVPAGEYARVEVNGRNVVDPQSYKAIEQTPVSVFSLFSAIHTGMVDAGEIIFFVLIIGGAFGVLTATGAVDAFIRSLSKKLGNKEKWLIPIMMLFFAFAGAFTGMAEETLAYIPILVPLAVSLGFDVITGTAIVLVGASIGFTTAIMNPFTVGIAQGIAQLPIFSGIGYRIILFVIMYAVSVGFIYRYAMKVKKDRSLGFYGEGVAAFEQIAPTTDQPLSQTHKWVLICFLLNFVALIYGVLQFQWYITEISALFVILAIVITLISRMSADQLIESFMKGAAGMLTGALIIGLSRATLVVLGDGHVIDTLLFHASGMLHEIPPVLSAAGMYILQALIHFVVPSGSGQAALTMPIMAPLADLVGVTRQTAVLSFSLADGIGNIIFPTSGYFMAGLALAGIPWIRWAKWILPLILMQFGIGLVAVIIANWMHYGPF